MDTPLKLLTADEVAAILKISKPEAYSLMRTILPCVRFNRLVRVRQQDLEAFILMHLSSDQAFPPDLLPGTDVDSKQGLSGSNARRRADNFSATDGSDTRGGRYDTQTR